MGRLRCGVRWPEVPPLRPARPAPALQGSGSAPLRNITLFVPTNSAVEAFLASLPPAARSQLTSRHGGEGGAAAAGGWMPGAGHVGAACRCLAATPCSALLPCAPLQPACRHRAAGVSLGARCPPLG